MQINHESLEKYTIQAYSNAALRVDNSEYKNSLILSRQSIISPWPVHAIQDLTVDCLQSMLALQPEVILIGHAKLGVQIPVMLLQFLSTQRIGIECMSIGAACRTFNVLLSEQRNVVLGVIF